jgi:hypothetical protein
MPKPINVRKIFSLSIDKVTKLKHNINIEFDDGEVIENCSYKAIIVYRCIMDIVNKIPNIKLNSNTYIDNYLNLGYFNYDTYTKMYSDVLLQYVNDVVKLTNDTTLIPALLREMYVAMNNISVHIVELGDYVIGIEILDVFSIQFRDSLLKSMTVVNDSPTQSNIEKTYNELDNILVELDKTNIIKLIYLSKMVNDNQLRQLFGSRGYITEIDSSIFTTPMSNSFALGEKNIYDMAIESRSSAKAYHLSHRAIQNTEYTARGLQLVTMAVERIWYGDCGNTDYTDFYVKEKSNTYKGDLPELLGKYYFNEETQKEEVITPLHTHLSGTTIKLRMVDNCKYPDKKKVCSRCFGDLSYSILEHQNLGHISSTNPTKDTTQSLLSTKHLTKSASTSAIVLNKTLEQFFIVKFKDKLFLQRRFNGRKTKGLKLHIPQNQVRSFEEILKMGNIMNINLDKVSWLYDLVMEEYYNTVKEKDEMFYPLEIKISSRIGIFTNYFWSYLFKYGYTVDEMDNYVIDLDKWDYAKPIIMYEKKEFDFAALGQQFSSLIKTRKYYKSNNIYKAEYTPNVLVEKLFNLLNSKLSTNIALLEVLVYSFTGKDINNYNYDLSRNSPNRELIGIKNAIDNRSIGASFGWNKLETKIFDPSLLIDQNRPDHPLDVIFTPNEVINDVGED